MKNIIRKNIFLILELTGFLFSLIYLIKRFNEPQVVGDLLITGLFIEFCFLIYENLKSRNI